VVLGSVFGLGMVRYVKERRTIMLRMKEVCKNDTCSVRVSLLLSTTLCCDIEYVCGGGYYVCKFYVEAHGIEERAHVTSARKLKEHTSVWMIRNAMQVQMCGRSSECARSSKNRKERKEERARTCRFASGLTTRTFLL
jgi:hypothetical protein